jgi:enoyl-CoA hydratase/carnithine racemase
VTSAEPAAQPTHDTSTGVVTYTVDAGVALLTLNRPDALNAWTFQMGREYLQSLDAAAADPDVRAVVITGAGRGFCAGADMGMLKDLIAGIHPTADSVRDDVDMEPAVPKPVIAAVNGPCVGLGLTRALYCDVRFLARGTKLSTAFVRRGLPAEDGTAWLLPRIVGWSHALDIMLSGRAVADDEAATLGLVDHVVDDALAAALDYARDIAASCSPASLREIKSQVWGDAVGTLKASMDRADGLMVSAFTRPDLTEGVASYLEKRPPRFPPLA